MHFADIKNERGIFTTGSMASKRTTKEYGAWLYANKFKNLGRQIP